MIRNLGNFPIMWALLMLAILLHNYKIKYHLRSKPIVGQDNPGTRARFEGCEGHVTDWVYYSAAQSFARRWKLRPHCERASPTLWKSFLHSEIFNFHHFFLVHLFLLITKSVYLSLETISTSVSCIEIRFYLSVLLVALWQCGFS